LATTLPPSGVAERQPKNFQLKKNLKKNILIGKQENDFTKSKCMTSKKNCVLSENSCGNTEIEKHDTFAFYKEQEYNA
jgi:hypothetical protein